MLIEHLENLFGQGVQARGNIQGKSRDAALIVPQNQSRHGETPEWRFHHPPPSADAGVVKELFGGYSPLFRSALSRMLRAYIDFGVPSSGRLDDQGARSQLQARVHALRGSAGLMGATRVMRLAGAAETALKQDCSIAILEPMLARLTSAFADMRDEAESWMARQVAREVISDAKAALHLAIGHSEFDDLHALLKSRNFAAVDKFDLLSPSLSVLLGSTRFGRLRGAMDSLDFPLAAQLLGESSRGVELAPVLGAAALE